MKNKIMYVVTTVMNVVMLVLSYFNSVYYLTKMPHIVSGQYEADLSVLKRDFLFYLNEDVQILTAALCICAVLMSVSLSSLIKKRKIHEKTVFYAWITPLWAVVVLVDVTAYMMLLFKFHHQAEIFIKTVPAFVVTACIIAVLAFLRNTKKRS